MLFGFEDTGQMLRASKPNEKASFGTLFLCLAKGLPVARDPAYRSLRQLLQVLCRGVGDVAAPQMIPKACRR
jgi:hypothetical protein